MSDNADDDQFWLDDAKPKPLADGLRMPAAAVVVPPDLAGSHATASADYRAMPRTSNTMPMVAGAVLLICLAAVGWLLWSRPVITLAEFNALQVGQSVDECNQVVGSPGKQFMAMDFPPELQTVADATGYAWENADGTLATASFIDGKLNAKFQVGLK
jgi:hypothetical protein